ncbi:reverse transcriptase domain-containing protein [Tanacetum coccineum]
MEKLVLSLVFAAKRLRRTSVKGKILVDFLVEKPDESPSDTSVVETPQEPWTLFTDGSSCVDFTASNNEAEYEALIAGLRIMAQMGKVKSLVSGIANFSISQVPRSKTKKADALSKIASTRFAHLSKQVLIKILKEKSIHKKEVTIMVEEDGPTWMTPIIEYLKEETLSDDRKEASKLRIKARYPVAVLQSRNDIEVFPGRTRNGQNFLLSRGLFHEMLEAKAAWRHKSQAISDNPFKDWCDKLNITQRFASVKHPQSNGLVERANLSLGEGIKARLGKGNKNWIEELPHVLWAYRTMIKSSHDDTPFSLTYGTKSVIPAEIGMPIYRTSAVDAIHNDEELRLNLDLLEKRREHAAIYEAKTKLKMPKYYNARVRGVTFRPGDFVCRSNDASHAVGGGKLGPKWEGPYEVTEALRDGAYKLSSIYLQDGKTLRSNGGHGYWDSIRPGMVGRTDPMGAAHHPTLLLLLSATYVSRDGVL